MRCKSQSSSGKQSNRAIQDRAEATLRNAVRKLRPRLQDITHTDDRFGKVNYRVALDNEHSTRQTN